MAYNWGNAAKPVAPFDGQVYVDNVGAIWRYGAAIGAWTRAPDLAFRQVRSFTLVVQGRSNVGSIFNAAVRTGTIGADWDRAYPYAFVEARSGTTGALLDRMAMMSRVELEAWLAAVTPALGGTYQTNPQVNVYEVFDPSMTLTRWNSWNGLYGSFRGRDCYMSLNGHGRNTLPGLGGAASGFAGYHANGDLAEQLLNHFYGVTPGAVDTRVCWSTQPRRGVYAMPRTSGPILQVRGIVPGRFTWNLATNTASAVTPVTNFLVTASPPLVRPNPCVIWRRANDTGLNYQSPTGLRGGAALSDNGNNGKEIMLAFAVHQEGNTDEVAFVIKPYGITKCAFQFDRSVTSATHDVVGVNWFRGSTVNPRFTLPPIEDRGHEGIRINDIFEACSIVNREPARMTIDDKAIPSAIRFYVREKTSGVRSEIFDVGVDVARRRPFFPIGFVDSRKSS